MKDGVREFDLDVEVAASGFSKGERQVLEAVSLRLHYIISCCPKEADGIKFVEFTVYGRDC
jgi:hypothetical protein